MGDETGALLSALSSLAPFAPPDRVVRTLHHALIELLEPAEAPPAARASRRRLRPSRVVSERLPSVEAWVPLRDRVLAVLAARGMSRRALATELEISLSTLKSVLLPSCRAPGAANLAKVERWLEQRPVPDGDAAAQHNGDAPPSETSTRLSSAQRERLAGYRSLDERSVRKSAGVTLETDDAIAGSRDLAPELIGRLVSFLDQQQPGLSPGQAPAE